MIVEVLQALGSWELTLDDATPRSVVDQLGYFGHLVVIDGPVDVEATGEALLDAARYAGVLRERDTEARKFAGSGMVYWLGDEDDKGDLIEDELTLTSQTLAQCVTAILPAAAPAGTIWPQPVPAQRYTGKHRFQTRRKALSIVCDAFGVEFRVNNDGTVDVGTRANLYQGVPRADGKPAPLIVRQPGTDIDLVALEGKLSAKGSVYDYSNRIVLVGQTTEAGEFATGSANAPSTPYVDLHGNPVKSTRLVSESTETTGSVASRSQLQLNRFNRITRTLSLDVEEYATEGTFRVGDDVYVYDPDSGIFDLARQLDFHGEPINPDVIRCSGVTWPVARGMTVAFRTGAGLWLDLTPFVTWETGGGDITVGDLPKSLTRPTDDPLALRVDASRATVSTAVPKPPTALSLGSSTIVDPRSGASTGRISAGWTAPTENTDNSVPVNFGYYLVQWRVTGQPSWHTTFTTDTAIDLAAVLDLAYDVQVFAVNPAGVRSTALTGTITVTRDTVGPPAPADPTVDGDTWPGYLRIGYLGATASAAPWPADTNRVDVHVSTTGPTFTHGPATLHASLTPFGAGVDLVETPPGATRWIKLVAVDHTGNEGTPSATVSGTVRAIRDGDIVSMNVSKLLAGTVAADVVIAGRFTTALTGARRELNSVGFQGWDATNNLTISLDGVNNLLTGIFRTALTGRRIEIGSAGFAGSIRFLSPDGTEGSVTSFTATAGVFAGAEGIRMRLLMSTTYSQLWNSVTVGGNEIISLTSGQVQALIGGSPSIAGVFSVRWMPNRGLWDETDAPPVGTITRFAVIASESIFYDDAGDYIATHQNTGQTVFWPGRKSGRDVARVLITNPAVTGTGVSAIVQLVTDTNIGATIKYLSASGLHFTSPSESVYYALNAGAFTVSSDERAKADIVDAPAGSLAALRRTPVRQYRRTRPAPRRRDDDPDGPVDAPADDTIEIGLVAQDALAGMPQVVRPMADDTLGVDLYQYVASVHAGLVELADHVLGKGKP
jgi:hypothetical protein